MKGVVILLFLEVKEDSERFEDHVRWWEGMFEVFLIRRILIMAAWIANKKSTGASLSPCLTPDLEGNEDVWFSMVRSTFMSV